MRKSKNKNREAKFFCENCGTEVNKNAKVCNYCGKFFSSVRCPKCGKIGNTDEFVNGCPDCGYAVGQGNLGSGGFNNINNKKYNSKASNSFINLFNSRKNNQSSDSLPVWIYIVTILVLIILVICLYSCL